jgi:predicted Zn-dependent protease
MWVTRTIRGATARVVLDMVDGASLQAAVRRAERLLLIGNETDESATPPRKPPSFTNPPVWSDATYQLDADGRAHVMHDLVQPAVKAGMLAAGYLQVSAHGRAVLDSTGISMYSAFTQAQFTTTVRSPDGTASGWAGVDSHDWGRIDAAALTATALDKCLRSRNPVRVEPGRYTVVLEPQAVCDFCDALCSPYLLYYPAEQTDPPFPVLAYHQKGAPTLTRLGQRLIDARLQLSSDPMDPELSFPPFTREGEVYQPTTWFDRGVLNHLAYDRQFAQTLPGANGQAWPSSGGFRMSSAVQTPPVTLDAMVANVERGIYVTRFSNVKLRDPRTLMSTGYTRDGTWMIEHGKITHPVKNLQFTDSLLFALNRVRQIGAPRRVFHVTTLPPGFNYRMRVPAIAPVIVPALTVDDFSFTGVSDAV